MRLKKFAKDFLNMYTPGIPDEDQCTGYKRLKEMVINQETPLEDDSNLLEFHVILRPFLKKYWETIKKEITMKTRLEKYTVCTDCHSVGITYNDCICTYQNNYPTIELEFEVCECCNNILNDGQCADTPFNKKQLKKLNPN